MFQKVKQFLGKVVATVTVACAALVGLVQESFAAISATDEASILTGVSASDSLFYKVGGGILVVMAGIWGFKRVRGMLGN
jgi:hypothetical protein